ncbi:MAG: hypothetical protein ACOX81_04980 [Candidatus Heteroscillospira sp.]|jgi:hypothetical protein
MKDVLVAETADVLKRLTPQNQKLIMTMVRVADVAESNVRNMDQVEAKDEDTSKKIL